MWDLFDLVVCEHKDGVSARRVGGSIALGQISKFFSKGPGPRVLEEWVILKAFVFGDGFPSGGVDDGKA